MPTSLLPHCAVPRAVVPNRAGARRRLRPRWQLSFLLPLIAVLLATTILPVVYSIGLSLNRSQGQLGLSAPLTVDNYRVLLGSRAFWQSLWLAVIFLVGALALELAVGVFTAMLLDRLLPHQRALRVLLLWPAVLPPIAVALIFKFLLQGDIGFVSYYLGKLGYDQAWLTHSGSAMAVIIGIDFWQYTPFVILLTLAALSAVPADVHEAAALDGAGPLRVARHIVLPMIKPALISIALLRFIDAIQVFPTIYVLTRGGPGSSTQLLTYFNYQIFFGQLQFSRGAAMAVLVVVFTVVCVVLLMIWQRRAERA